MKILFCGYRNPNFITVTEYSERALAAAGAEVRFFNDRGFALPGRLRESVPLLGRLDLAALNRRLVRAAAAYRPDVVLACGGTRVLPSALRGLRDMGIATVLWTIDPPQLDSPALLAAAPFYDRIFCGGTEAVELFEQAGIKGAEFLPFACDPAVHRPLPAGEAAAAACDICFMGSVHPELYPGRVKLLESISDLDLKVWGPGTGNIPASSPLFKRVAGGQVPPDLWRGIYASARIVLCMHFSDPRGKYPCYQASPRVYEAMACGAFLLCDAQKDVLSLFREGEHLAVFRGAGDLREKINYYLAAPAERAAIAAAGRAEVLAKHTYLHRMKALLGSVRRYEERA
jgi:spore maturation protein CgeB